MTNTTSPSIPTRLPAVMLIGLLALLGYLIWRSYGWNPAVFADEWSYSKFSHLAPMAESIVPSYLYLWVMSATTACGTGFLECARVVNVLAFVAAAPFLYLIARQFTTNKVAVWVALLSTMLPMGSYTAFFMPEASYYFAFCVLSWYVLAPSLRDDRVHAAIAGVLLGLLSLIKVHAVFLLPALCLYLLFLQALDATRPRSYLRSATIVLLAVGAMLATKFGISYLLVGKAGLSLFGPFYGSTASAKPDRLLLLAMLWKNGRGHLMAVILLYAVPLAILLQSLLAALARRSLQDRTLKLQVYTFLMLGSTAGLAVLYTASIATMGADEALRLHLRYYDFVFPLLLIGAAGACDPAGATRQRVLPWILAAVGAAILLFAAVGLPQYRVLLVDAPDIFSIVNDPLTLYIVAGFGIALLVLWAIQPRRGAVLFLFAFLPATVVLAEVRLRPGMHYLADESYFDTAAKFVRDNLPLEDRKQLTVMGSNVAQLMRTLFVINTPGADYIEVPYRAPIAKEQLPVNRKWVLIVDVHPLPDDVPVNTRAEQFVLLEMGRDYTRGAYTAVMNTVMPSGLITKIEGLSGREEQGRWSDAKQVVFHTAQPLPKDLTLTIRAAAYGPNVGKPFIVHVGDAVATMTPGAVASDHVLVFKTDGQARTVTIDVPQPTSPLSLDGSHDSRTLGVMLHFLTFKNNE